MKKTLKTIWAILFVLLSAPAWAGEMEDLFAAVETLGIQRQGYTLCARLTEDQQAFAAQHPEQASSRKVYRFRDKNLNVVVDQATHRVLVLFEQFEGLAQPQVQELMGDLFQTYGDPTVSAHDRVVLWAWGKSEKFTAMQYQASREKKEALDIIATIKLNSEVRLMDPSQGDKTGNAFYIISSDPLLPFFKDE